MSTIRSPLATSTGVALDISNVPHCELRRHTGERAHARIIGMQLTASGQVRSKYTVHISDPVALPFISFFIAEEIN